MPIEIKHAPEERMAIMVSPETISKLKKKAVDLDYGGRGMRGFIEDMASLPTSRLKALLEKPQPKLRLIQKENLEPYISSRPEDDSK